MFINYTNHPSEKWSLKQLEAAQKYGEIHDIPFPVVSPEMGNEELIKIAGNELIKITIKKPDCVLCQGEAVLSHYLVSILKENGIKVVAACSRRNVNERNENGKTIKSIEFEFIQFREY